MHYSPAPVALAMENGQSARRDLRRRHIHRELAVAIPERFGIDLFELDRAAEHPLLPGLVFGIVPELRHHFRREQLQRLADMLVAVLAGLVEQDHLVDMRGAEAPQ